MSTIRGMLRKVIEAKQGIEPTMLRIVNDNKQIIIDLNREKQLALGLNPDGELIGVYSRATELAYLFDDDYNPSQPKEEGKPYNFQDQDDLFKSFKLEYKDGSVTISNNDSKLFELEAKYGGLIGITENNEYTLNYEIIKEPLFKYIKDTIRR